MLLKLLDMAGMDDLSGSRGRTPSIPCCNLLYPRGTEEVDREGRSLKATPERLHTDLDPTPHILSTSRTLCETGLATSCLILVGLVFGQCATTMVDPTINGVLLPPFKPSKEKTFLSSNIVRKKQTIPAPLNEHPVKPTKAAPSKPATNDQRIATNDQRPSDGRPAISQRCTVSTINYHLPTIISTPLFLMSRPIFVATTPLLVPNFPATNVRVLLAGDTMSIL